MTVWVLTHVMGYDGSSVDAVFDDLVIGKSSVVGAEWTQVSEDLWRAVDPEVAYWDYELERFEISYGEPHHTWA